MQHVASSAACAEVFRTVVPPSVVFSGGMGDVSAISSIMLV
jgi:hypothetical protein